MDFKEIVSTFGPTIGGVIILLFATRSSAKEVASWLFSDDLVDDGSGRKVPRGKITRIMNTHMVRMNKMADDMEIIAKNAVSHGDHLAQQTDLLRSMTGKLDGTHEFQKLASEPHSQFSTVATNRAMMELADAIHHLSRSDPIKVELYCERVKRTLRRYIKKNGTDSDLEQPLST